MATPRRHHAPALALVGLLLVGCSSNDSPSDPSNDVATTTTSVSTTSEAPIIEESTTTVVPATEYPMVRGSRYCELLFLRVTTTGLQATVYGTQGLSYCPQAEWDAIDTTALATEMEAVIALRNGPRIWLVDSVVKNDIDASERRFFGELEMNRLAVVDIADPSTVGRPYTWQEVDRRSIFTFVAGSTEFFLTDPEGNRWVMQALSQTVDPAMSEEGLSTLADRLALPDGWTYSVEVLNEDLVVDTMNVKARVLQDEFQNSYSLVRSD